MADHQLYLSVATLKLFCLGVFFFSTRSLSPLCANAFHLHLLFLSGRHAFKSRFDLCSIISLFLQSFGWGSVRRSVHSLVCPLQLGVLGSTEFSTREHFHKNNKSFNIENYFFQFPIWILLQFNDLTS